MEATRERAATSTGTTTIGSLIERYLRSVPLSPNTLQVRQRALRWAFAPIAVQDVQSLTGTRLEGLFVAKKDTAGGHWMNTCAAAIQSLIKWSMRREIMDRDISRFWPRVRAVSQRCIEPLDAGELNRLMGGSPPSLRLFVLLGVYFGARRQNLCDLDWSWISEDWVVTIPATHFKQRRVHVEPLHPRIIDELRGLRRPSGLVMQGLPSPSNIGAALKAVARKVGVDPRKVYPHALRATFATMLSESGANVAQIMQLGGWSSADVVTRRYIRPMNAETGRSLLGRM
jgi:integrase